MEKEYPADSQALYWGKRLKLFGLLTIAAMAISMTYVWIQSPPNWQRGLIAMANISLLLAAGWSMMRLMEAKRSGTSASSRYIKRMMILAVVYVAGLFFAESMFDAFALKGVPAVLVALVPALGIIGFIWAMGRYLLEEEDEYIRMRETQKFIMATGFMMVIVTIYGFLQQYELVPDIPGYFAFVVWCVGLGFAALVQWRRG